jgi:hypothetical protein
MLKGIAPSEGGRKFGGEGKGGLTEAWYTSVSDRQCEAGYWFGASVRRNDLGQILGHHSAHIRGQASI